MRMKLCSQGLSSSAGRQDCTTSWVGWEELLDFQMIRVQLVPEDLSGFKNLGYPVVSTETGYCRIGAPPCKSVQEFGIADRPDRISAIGGKRDLDGNIADFVVLVGGFHDEVGAAKAPQFVGGNAGGDYRFGQFPNLIAGQVLSSPQPQVAGDGDGVINRGISGVRGFEGRDVISQLLNAIIDCLEPGVDGVESSVDGLKSGVNLVKSSVNLVESSVNLVESGVNLVESGVMLIQACCDAVQALVRGVDKFFHRFGELCNRLGQFQDLSCQKTDAHRLDPLGAFVHDSNQVLYGIDGGHCRVSCSDCQLAQCGEKLKESATFPVRTSVLRFSILQGAAAYKDVNGNMDFPRRIQTH